MRRLLRFLSDLKTQVVINGGLFALAVASTLYGSEELFGVSWFAWVCHLVLFAIAYPPDRLG